jgi:Mn-dependent DtxR family transcriptional regulator
MALDQIHWEAIEKAHHEERVDTAGMVSMLLLDPGKTALALADLVEPGLMKDAEDDSYRLTDAGEEAYQARIRAESAAVRRATPSWPHG